MMNLLRISIVLALAALLGGCSTTSMTHQALPDRRPADFTLGVVVFGQADAQAVERRSARYIVDPAGNLRASVGDGSAAATYPKITRRLSAAQLDEIWSMVERLNLSEPIADEPMPTDGYLIEIRAGQMSRAWVVDDSAAGVVGLMAELAWIRE